MGAVAVGALLLALLLLIVAAFVFQGVRRSSVNDFAEYLVPEAAEFVRERLSERALSGLDVEDVRMVLEWNLHYNQVIGPRSTTGPMVLGSGDGLDYVLERAAESHRVLDPFDVAEVMAIEPEYLLSIGAIGGPVEGEPA